jgi:hypothetical protein
VVFGEHDASGPKRKIATDMWTLEREAVETVSGLLEAKYQWEVAKVAQEATVSHNTIR